MIEALKRLFARKPEELTAREKILRWRLAGCPAASRPREIDSPWLTLPDDNWVTVSDTQRGSSLARRRRAR